jgi:molybdate transport system ATP-binding protein
MKNGFEIRVRQQLGSFTLDVQLESAAGGVTAIFGPSGSGKTSLINAIAGLSQPEQAFISVGGHVLVDTKAGVFVKPHLRRVGYVFQDARLFPHLSVARNLAYGQPKTRGANPGGPGLADVLEALGIAHLLERFPRDLSGGEAQRVAIGRALMSEPELLLMDEPLASLDQARRGEILPCLDRLQALSGVQVFYVSHAMAEVARLADQIVLLRAGQVVRAGPAGDILSDPDLVPEIGLGEAGAVLSARLVEPDAGDGLSRLETSAGELFLPRIKAGAGRAVRVRILASDIILSRERPTGLSALNILPAQITGLRQGVGPGMAVALQSGEDRLLARITRRSAFALGLSVGMRCYAVIKSVSVAPGNVSAG